MVFCCFFLFLCLFVCLFAFFCLFVFFVFFGGGKHILFMTELEKGLGTAKKLCLALSAHIMGLQ